MTFKNVADNWFAHSNSPIGSVIKLTDSGSSRFFQLTASGARPISAGAYCRAAGVA